MQKHNEHAPSLHIHNPPPSSALPIIRPFIQTNKPLHEKTMRYFTRHVLALLNVHSRDPSHFAAQLAFLLPALHIVMQRGLHQRAQRHTAHAHIAHEAMHQGIQLHGARHVRQSLRLILHLLVHLQRLLLLVRPRRDVERDQLVLVAELHPTLVAQIEVGTDGTVPARSAHDVVIALVAGVIADRDRGVETVIQNHHRAEDGTPQLTLILSLLTHLIELVVVRLAHRQEHLAVLEHARQDRTVEILPN